MEVTHLLACDYANVSREGKLNLMGLFDSISAKKFPAVHPAMQVVARFALNRTEVGRPHKVEFILMDEDGQKLFAMEGQMHIKPSPSHKEIVQHDQILAINNCVFPKAGRYQIVVQTNNEVKKSLTLFALERPSGPVEPPPNARP